MEDKELDEIPIVEGGISFDASKYQGFRTQIENVITDKEAINWYNGPLDSKGRPTYNPNSIEKMWKIIVETKPLPKLDDKDNPTNELLVMGTDENGKPKYVRARATFNLSYKDNKWVISKAPQAKLWKFMRKCGAAKLSELKDKRVTLDTSPDQDETSDRVWLRISI